MTSNRMSQYLDRPEAQYPASTKTVENPDFQDSKPTAGGLGCALNAFEVNRIAWENAKQMVIAKRQLRNRIARFL